MRTALEGLQVLDFTQIGAGPTCTMLLADMGARVVKVETPSGETGRTLGPGWIGDDSALFHGFNRGKLGLSLDLKRPEAVEVARRLAAQADIVVESMRPGVMDRLGLGYEQLRELRPDLIYCSISAYGQTGPYSQRAGVDGILQADSGLMSLLGTESSEPCKVQAPVVDVMTGYVAAVGVLAKIVQRARDGQGGHLDVNLLNSALALQQSSLTSFLADGELPKRTGSAAPYAAPNQAFQTADGWLMVAAYTPERWSALCDVLDVPSVAEDPRFATSTDRVANRAALVEALTAVFVIRTTEEWMTALRARDILCAKVATYNDLPTHPQILANRMLAEVNDPRHGIVRMPGFPISSVASAETPYAPAPGCGEHSDQILLDLGLDAPAIQRLRDVGALRCA